MFGIVERHFSAQARLSVILVGLSGLYMLNPFGYLEFVYIKWRIGGCMRWC